ncbi:ABC-type nitrate/sulfonate/bicarbonate transport system permease component [Mumia flava]|uniref:ABC-type nitrate/sulfonate/bicarbonate transport system permease component n=1 Tax=Mumia flava TaxID=1348852 RepID=A0A0B2B7V9_9ACTN|nr:ABC transporter permease subunit [Mumia flava]PJJ57903.1 ABC-type nitrate/sulfonate/bicarbonate transport system permease component [Mumia flava]
MRRLPAPVTGAIGIAVVLGLWTLAGVLGLAGGAIPTPWTVLQSMVTDGWDVYGPNFTVTARSALEGFLWGNVLAIGLAVLVVLIPPIEPVATQLAIISYCTPILALGPIVLVLFGGRAPSVFLAAISVFFTTMVGTLSGFRSAERASLDLVRAYGGGRWQQFRRVQWIAALPGVFASLKIAAPAAVLGTILGEYLGGIDTGVGVALTAAQQNSNIPRTWGFAIGAGLLAGLGYLIVSLIGRAVTPWATAAPRTAGGVR